jgi:L,D-peptidoglycan transpeptidase YkuD (ErfK/YbiS/YcfS/YnhG family)
MYTLAVAAALCLHATGSARQLVTVDAASVHGTTAVVRVYRRDGACWRPLAGPWPAHVGRNGLSAHHREGDGTTPIGTFAIGGTAYGLAPNPGTNLAYHPLVCGDWWDEDSSSPTYNRFRHVRCGTSPPFHGDSEALWEQTAAYAHFAVIEYNSSPAVPGRGSAIFIHVDLGTPTNGCVTLRGAALDELLRLLRPADAPAVSIRLRAA